MGIGEEACRDYAGFECPVCGHRRYYRVVVPFGRQGRDLPLNLSYRFNLAAQVQPGTYAWPLALSVRPL